jgi:hypothetical protein
MAEASRADATSRQRQIVRPVAPLVKTISRARPMDAATCSRILHHPPCRPAEAVDRGRIAAQLERSTSRRRASARIGLLAL